MENTNNKPREVFSRPIQTETFFDSKRLFWSWVYISFVVGNLSLICGGWLTFKTFILGKHAVMVGELENLDSGANWTPPAPNAKKINSKPF